MKLLPPATEVKKFLIIFYGIGITGFAMPSTRALFIKLIPFALVMNIFLLLYFHEPAKIRNFFWLGIIAILGFFIEVVGVKTGLLFGNYFYGKVLGPKVLEVPLIIGINWLVLSYGFSVLTASFVRLVWLKVLIAALLITLFDVVMEPVAVFTGMWNWPKGSIPLQNYIMWFFVSLLFMSILSMRNFSFRNPVASLLIVLQFLFFLSLNLIIRLL